MNQDVIDRGRFKGQPQLPQTFIIPLAFGGDLSCRVAQFMIFGKRKLCDGLRAVSILRIRSGEPNPNPKRMPGTANDFVSDRITNS